MKRKVLALVLVAGLIAGLMAACGGGTSSNDTPGSPAAADTASTGTAAAEPQKELTGTFQYWSCYSGDSAKWEQWRVDEFNKKFESQGLKCEVQFVPDGAGISNGKLLSAIASGTGPDLIVVDNATNAYSYAANGSFEPLDSYLEKAGIDIKGFFPGTSDVMYYKDSTYLIPQDSNVVMLYYNVDLVKAAGLDPENPPKTIEDLDKWAEALTIKNSDGSYKQLGFIPWQDHGGEAWIMPFLFGANVYDTDTNKLDLTSAAVQNYLKWVKSYADKYGIEKINAITANAGGRSTPDHPFYNKKIAMTVTLNSFTHLMDVYGPKDINYKVAPVPTPADGSGRADSTTFITNVFAVPKGAKNIDQALQFVHFSLSAEISADNYDTWRSIPCIDSEFDKVSWTQKGDEIYALERKLANSPKSGIPALTSVSTELGDAFKTLRESVIYSKADIASSLQALQDQYQAELDAKK